MSLEAYIVKIVAIMMPVPEYSASPHMFWFSSSLLDLSRGGPWLAPAYFPVVFAQRAELQSIAQNISAKCPSAVGPAFPGWSATLEA